jgi:hypothetical protein
MWQPRSLSQLAPGSEGRARLQRVRLSHMHKESLLSLRFLWLPPAIDQWHSASVQGCIRGLFSAA